MRRAVLVRDDGQRRDSRMGLRGIKLKRLATRVTGVLAVLALGTGGGDVRARACVVAA